ncbi:hypothetical protein DACRYDRAFT_22726 [Dacryopinax primogenitus]|uniref:Phosphatidate cytidylyltransferase n=1 Tax=Dacryopinax primogenitus (strain DJM 731) TaxID=1858805 RepID=M5FYT8_DACPD|nr:uncharacterized protein DACRYDRAFT_22726 [Dacryopinax primogenitus]EJU01674.1 hypothetical protein DACRYDRAFT_22726 [Dacryopinax primogenitus]
MPPTLSKSPLPSTSYNLRTRRPTSLDNRSTPGTGRAQSPRRRSRPALLRQASASSLGGTGTMGGTTRTANGHRRSKSKSKTANGTSVPNGVAVHLEEENPTLTEAPTAPVVEGPQKPSSKAQRRPMRKRANSLTFAAWSKLNLEIPRKTMHSSAGLLTLALYMFWPEEQSLTPIIAGVFILMCFILIGDFLRFEVPSIRAEWEKHLGKFMRESEKTKINGTVWYCLGAIICLYCYPRDIAVASIMILAWCDTAASIVGRLISSSRRLSPYSPKLPNPLFGYIPIARTKSLGGTLAGGIVGACISWGMFGHTWGCVVVAFIAGIAEAVDIGGLDDNLTLPVLSGAMIWLLRIATGLV